MQVTDEDRKFWAFLPLKRPPEPAVKDAALAAHADRLVRPGEAGREGADAERPGRPAQADPPGVLRPARPAADAGGGRGVRRRPRPRRLRQADRPAARQPALRRALGPALARPGPLRREPRLRARLRPADRLPLPRLRHQGVQPGFALRHVRQVADRRRRVRAGQPAGADGHRLPRLPASTARRSRKTRSKKSATTNWTTSSRTTGTAMLGLTVGCARCHDHKYDPIPTRDYYRMLSTFTTTVRSRDGHRLRPGGDARRRGRSSTPSTRKLVEALTKYETEQLAGQLRAVAGRAGSASDRNGGRAGRILDVAAQIAGRRRRSRSRTTARCWPAARTPTSTPTPSRPHTTLQGHHRDAAGSAGRSVVVKGGPGRAANGNFALSDFRVTAAPLNGRASAGPGEAGQPEGDVRAEGPAGRGGHRRRQEVRLGGRSAVRQGPRRRLRDG